jgi:hypothetical protein
MESPGKIDLDGATKDELKNELARTRRALAEVRTVAQQELAGDSFPYALDRISTLGAIAEQSLDVSITNEIPFE